MSKKNFANQVLLCVSAQGLFSENEYYYCFADEGHHFWIHAPFLLEKIGVDQIKVSSGLRENFVTREEYEEQNRRICYRKKEVSHLTG